MFYSEIWVRNKIPACYMMEDWVECGHVRKTFYLK